MAHASIYLRTFIVLAVIGLTGLELSTEAAAQSFSFDFGPDESSTTGRVVQMLLFMTVISVAPAILRWSQPLPASLSYCPFCAGH